VLGFLFLALVKAPSRELEHGLQLQELVKVLAPQCLVAQPRQALVQTFSPLQKHPFVLRLSDSLPLYSMSVLAVLLAVLPLPQELLQIFSHQATS